MKSYLLIGILFLSRVTVAQNTFPNNGNVGIGISNPSYKLEVHGEQTLFRLLTSNSTPSYPAIDIHNGVSGTEFVLSPSVDKVDMFTYSNHPLALGTGAAEKMRISTNGNVGIGTTNPSSLLELSNAIPILTLTPSVYNGPYKTSFGTRANAQSYLIFGNNGHNEIRAGNSVTGGYLDFLTNNTMSQEAESDGNFVMRMAANGNVGIGTKLPTEKLAVNGKIRAQEIKVEAAPWPDYVFTKSYPLPSLQETEKHIKEKGHLQGIPSAAEVKANGIDLGEMNAKLLQKIEELTLHLIEKDKEIKMIKSDYQELRKMIIDGKSKNNQL